MTGAIREPSTGTDLSPEKSTTAFGKYQLFASLGRGGMADVFLSVARGQMGVNRLVVIKRLRQALAEEVSFRTMFLDEARLAARLAHPNIVHTYEVGEHQGVYFIAMEFLEGQSLNKIEREAIRKKQFLEPDVCARIIADALTGLHHAHELTDYDGSPLGIIHRDVSPHNIFVTYDGHTKLVDIGIAKAALSSTETEDGVLKGKVAYMAPEQASGGHVDRRADVFAMGIVLWEMIARRRLMSGENAAATLNRLMNMPIPPLSKYVPEIDRELESIVAKSLMKDRELRFQTALEMRDALDHYLSRAGSPRADEVGRRVLALFTAERDEVQRQIQKYMALVNAATSTEELQALGRESLRTMDGPAGASGALLKLGSGSGSGSGVVSHFPAIEPSVAAPVPVQNQNRHTVIALLILLISVVVLLGAALVFVLMKRTDAGPLPHPGASATVVVVDPGASTPDAAAAFAAGPSTGTPVAPTPPPQNHGGGKPAKPNTPAPTPAAPKPSVATATPSEETGFLTFSSYPWTSVSEGGKVLGTTPLIKVPLSAGSHTLTLENPEQGIKKTYVVTIAPGQTLVRNLGLK